MVFATLFTFVMRCFFVFLEWNERKKVGVSWQNRTRWLELKGWHIRRLKFQWKLLQMFWWKIQKSKSFKITKANQSCGWWKMLGPFWKLLEPYYLHPLSNRPLQTRPQVFINGWRYSFMTLMPEFIISKAYFDGLWCLEILLTFQLIFMKIISVRPAFKERVHPKMKIVINYSPSCRSRPVRSSEHKLR